MRYPASEKLEIIRLVEESRLPVKRTLEKLGVSRSKFYRWYDLHRRFGVAGLEDRRSAPGRVWNRVPEEVRGQVIDLALERPELSPRELAVTFTDEKAQFISEASVYRLLRANGLLTSPAFIVMKAADEFRDKTTAPNQLWQTDFTYLKVIGWGWFYLSTILDDFSRFIVAWKLCTTMKAADVTETVEAAVRQRVELRRGRSGDVAWAAEHQARARSAQSSDDAGQDRALASDDEESNPARELLLARRP
jgi:transposase InsO family protein